VIIIEDMSPDTTHKYFAYRSLFRAINKNGVPIFLWNSSQKNIFDVYDELKPDKVLFYNDHTRAANKLAVPYIDYQKWYKHNPLVSDPLIYKRLEPVEDAKFDTICIAPYPEFDNFTDEFLKAMDRRTRYFRYFGYKAFGGHKDCGPIPENLHSLLLSSAKRIICLSKQFAINARLCNKNIVGYDVTDKETELYSSLNLVKELI